jgi:hypothetical protein
MKYSGRCLCGEVRYETDADSVFMGNCHCADCQRASGGPFAPVMMFPVGTVAVVGTPKYFLSRGDSGSVIDRGFCQACGSQLFVKLEALPGLLGVRPGSLDVPSLFQPSLDFYVSSATSCNHMDPAIPKRPLSPRGPDA